MNRELARKRPREIVMRVAGNNLPRTEVIRRPTKSETLAVVKRMVERGEIGNAVAVYETDAAYAVKVLRIREPRRGGFRWWLLLAFLTSAALSILALWLLAKALAPFLPVLLIGGAVLVLLANTGRRGSSVTVNQSVRFHHHS